MSKENYRLPRASTPEEVGVSSKEVKEFLHDCDRLGLNIHSIMVVRDGKVAAEASWAPYDGDIPHSMFSFSKQVTSLAVGFAINEGLLSLDDHVCKFFPYSSGDEKLDAKNREITVYDLLTHRSGKNISIFTTNNEKNEWLQNWLSAPFNSKTGEKFNYLSENIYILSRLVSKVSGQGLVEYLTPRLFEPLGIEPPYWEHDHNGYDAGGWGAFLTTEDMAKIGICFVNNGEFNGKQVIPADWIKQSTTRHLDAVPSRFTATQAYGFQVFIQPEKQGTYSFNGLYSQFNVMFPAHNAVFTCTGGETRERDILLNVWKHFPAAFIDSREDKPEDFDALKKYEAKIAGRTPPIARRYPETEAKINNRLIKTTARANASVLGSGNNFMLSARAGKLNSIRFRFSEDDLTLEFTEKNSPMSTISVGLDGEYLFSEIQLSELKTPVAACGTWVSENTFKINVYPLNMAQYRVWLFHFLPGGFVRVTSHAKPGFKELFEFYLQFNGTAMNEPLSKLCTGVGAIATTILDPNFYGKIK